MKKRCQWANTNELEKEYHDNEWGIPVYDDNKLFELLVLESMQAGLSWSTILAKRESMRFAFDDFNYMIIKDYNEAKKETLLNDSGIIRNKLKVNATISNAKAFIIIQEEYKSFSNYIWGFTNNEVLVNHWENIEDVPASTELSDKISKDLKKRGFKFLGTTTIYAYLQAIGIVDDHMEYCFKKEKTL
ncbi:MAG: DNA-3-methyladenine glycosylase I [Erysipelotrichales bacterium]